MMKGSNHGPWNDDRVALLTKLWAEGLSASEIAKRLRGISRNAVIGKVHRLGLSGRAVPSKPSRAVAVKPRAPKAPPVKRNAAFANGMHVDKRKLLIAGNGAVLEKPEGQPPRAVVPVRAWAALPGSAPRPWTDRKPFGECRWPIDVAGAEELHSCCLPARERYCETHERMSAPAGRSPAQIEADRLRAERMALGVVRPRRGAA